jgi:hypothetical protein
MWRKQTCKVLACAQHMQMSFIVCSLAACFTRCLASKGSPLVTCLLACEEGRRPHEHSAICVC